MANTRLKTRPDSVLEDPGMLAVAGLYARSYLTAANQAGVAEQVEELNSFVDDVLGQHPEIAETFSSDFVSRDQKLNVVDRAIAPMCSEYFSNFLRVLIRHGRIDLLSVIRRVITGLQEEAAGQARVKVKAARPLSG